MEPCDRLRIARETRKYTSPAKAAEAFGWNVNSYKSHENGIRGLKRGTAERYAMAFRVSLAWLLTGEGSGPSKAEKEESPSFDRVPVIDWISAGEMAKATFDGDIIGTEVIVGLPKGDWIALEVRGDSMDRISPPESVILVNRKDKKLVANACYVIADEDGSATYKRYRPGPMRFEPVSTNSKHEPIFPDQEPFVVGRVRRSILKM